MTLPCNINSKRSLRPVRSTGSQDFSKVFLNGCGQETYERPRGPLQAATVAIVAMSGATDVSFFQLRTFVERAHEDSRPTAKISNSGADGCAG
jgi:hypothetical protein